MNFDTIEADVDLILNKHFTQGRGGKGIDKVVLHYNAGNLTVEGCFNVWQTREASAHYQVESGGRVGQIVWDRDTAWHCGVFDQNQRSLGIEHANMADGTITETCLDTGAHLVAALCKYYGLGRPEWLVNVFPHKHFQATSCPGQIYGSQKDSYMSRAQYWYDLMTGAADPEPEPGPATSLPEVLRRFIDLDPDAWYVGAVEEAVREGWMHGTSDSTFEPSSPLTRGQAVCVIANANGEDLNWYLDPFKDVVPAPFYYTALCWAVDRGVVAEQDNFRPNDAATRAEFVTMLWNWRGKPEVGTDADLSDVPEWARGAVAWAHESGVIDQLRPNDPCSRAEAAAMLCNLSHMS